MEKPQKWQWIKKQIKKWTNISKHHSNFFNSLEDYPEAYLEASQTLMAEFACPHENFFFIH